MYGNKILKLREYAVKAQTSLATLSWFHGSRVTTAHVHQCCIFQSYAKTVPSRMKLTMKLTMREPAFMGSMTTDTWSRRVTYDFNSVLGNKDTRNIFYIHRLYKSRDCYEASWMEIKFSGWEKKGNKGTSYLASTVYATVIT